MHSVVLFSLSFEGVGYTICLMMQYTQYIICTQWYYLVSVLGGRLCNMPNLQRHFPEHNSRFGVFLSKNCMRAKTG